MFINKAQLKRIIKEELQKTLYEADDNIPMIPDVPAPANQWGQWAAGDNQNVKEANKYLLSDPNVVGKYNINNSCVVVYGKEPRMQKVVAKMWFPDSKKGYGQALQQLENELKKAGFQEDPSLTVFGSQG